MDFLDEFHLDVAYDVHGLRHEAGLLMTANGLRSDDIAVDLGAGWVANKSVPGTAASPSMISRTP